MLRPALLRLAWPARGASVVVLALGCGLPAYGQLGPDPVPQAPSDAQTESSTESVPKGGVDQQGSPDLPSKPQGPADAPAKDSEGASAAGEAQGAGATAPQPVPIAAPAQEGGLAQPPVEKSAQAPVVTPPESAATGAATAAGTVGDAPPAPGAPLGPVPVPTRSPLPTYEPRYRAASEATLWCDSIELAAPDRVRRFDLATTRDGRVTPALEIAAPGPIPPSERPTLFVIGGLDGRSLAGSEAALYVARELAQNVEDLGPDISIVVAPFANVEALDQCARSGASDGRTLRPFDDDHDGRVDEDGPDDIDDDGLVLEMLVESPDGDWMLSDDSRWVLPATAGAGRRFLREREGRDDDGDGRFNEDPVGGVDLDRNFPVLRDGPWSDARVGALPLSEPVSRSLAELARSRTCMGVLLLQGHHGGVALPGGVAALDAWTAADRELYAEVAARFEKATGRPGLPARTLREAHGVDCPGAALDWFAVSCGALSLELAPWGPQLDEASPTAPKSASFEPRPIASLALAPADLAWARWLDEARDGMGYVSWRPVALGDGRAAYVGGFEPWTVENPPPDSLERALQGLPNFVRGLCADAPRLTFERMGVTRSAGVLRLRTSLRNIGALPTGLRASAASTTARPLTVRLELDGDARLLAGAQTVRVPPLAGGELSREIEWLVLAASPTSVRLSAQGGWCPTITREVRE